MKDPIVVTWNYVRIFFDQVWIGFGWGLGLGLGVWLVLWLHK